VAGLAGLGPPYGEGDVMENQAAVTRPGAWITAIVLGAVVVAGVAVWKMETSSDRGGQGSERFAYDLGEHKKIDPDLFHYRESHAFAVPMSEPRAIAVGSDQRIYVAGDQAIVVFDANGTTQSQMALDDSPRCLTVAAGLVFVGMREHVEVYDLQGSRVTRWPTLGEKALLTSIAADETAVFVADAGNRVVWHCDREGKVIKPIGKRDEERHIRGFVIPSPYFDVALSPDGLIRVANPGARRVEGFTVDGDLEVVWGKASLAIEGFCGCCNPANFALFPDGRFVTVEKGLPRVKVYDPEGQFVAVVAGPEQLTPTPTITEETRAEHRLAVFDVAADAKGRVLLLDPSGCRVRVFEPRENPKATTEKNDE
jgi:hypothetical protein